MSKSRPVYVVTVLRIGHSPPLAAFSSKSEAESWAKEIPAIGIYDTVVTKLLPNQFKAKGT